MKFDKAFKKQSKLVQVLLLLIPGVNWVTELLVKKVDKQVIIN